MANIWGSLKDEFGSFIKNQTTNLLNKFLHQNGIITLSCDDETLTFPVTPSEFGVQVSNHNGQVNIINAGEYNMIGKTGLKTITIDSFFPAQKYTFSSFSANPYELINLIERWRIGVKPLNISVYNSPINFDCLIESFSYKEQDASKDVYFSLQLKEYRKIIDTLLDEKTGLKERQSALQKFGIETAVQIINGKSALDAIKESGRKALVESGEGYLQKYEKVVKSNQLNKGDYIQITNNNIKINDMVI